MSGDTAGQVGSPRRRSRCLPLHLRFRGAASRRGGTRGGTRGYSRGSLGCTLIWSIVPIGLAVLFSFNKGKSQSVWQGFSLRVVYHRPHQLGPFMAPSTPSGGPPDIAGSPCSRR